MNRWSFGAVTVDERNFELRVDGERVDIDRKPLEVLVYLLHHAGTAVRKDALAKACWPGRILSDSVLDKTLSRVREALAGEKGAIETVRGVGWRLSAPVRKEVAGSGVANVPGNLPAAMYALVGRESVLKSAQERLSRARLLTFTGCGGIGKTSLSLALARCAAAEFPEGIYFVDLAPVRSPELFVSAVAQALGVREAGHQPLLQGVRDHLRTQRALLVLDNFEQVVAAAPLLAEVLAACAGVKAIVTSRERLNLRGEMELEVPSLAVPPEGAPLDEVRASPAVSLFEQRAQQVKPDFKVGESNVDDVAEICRRLDGVPLAIELAAARGKLFDVRTLRERLIRRFDVLTDGPRDLPPRQQALWATVDWSYDLLDDSERSLLRRLSVFAAGFTLEAARAVGTGAPVEPADVFALLARLVDKSLVLYEDQGVAGRYRMLETIREYASERLDQAGERASASARLLAHLGRLAEEAGAHVYFFLPDPRMGEWLPRLTLEHANLRSALAWGAQDPQRAPSALKLAAALHWYWFSAGHITEGVSLLRSLLERTPDVPGLLRAQALTAAANIAVEQGGTEAQRGESLAFARQSLDAALAVFRGQAERSWTAYALSSLAALIVTANGDPAEAMRHVGEGLAIAREQNDRWLISFLTHFLGRGAWFQGELEFAKNSFAESIEATRMMGGNSIGEGYGTYWLGRIARAQGDLDTARTHHLEALRLFHESGHLQGIASALTGVGGVAARKGEARTAVTLLAIVAHWRSQLRTFLEPDLDAEHGQDWAHACAMLDAAACEKLSAAAARMDVAQAVACARS